MLNNNLRTAYRQLVRHRSYTIINIAGLAAGIAVCLLIFVYIRFETSFDEFHSKKARIFRVMTEFHHPDMVFTGQPVASPIPTAIRHEFPQLEKTAGIYAYNNAQILILAPNGSIEKKFKERKGVFSAEPAFFDIFDFPWLAGNPATSLADPNSVVLSKETAEKYFGDWRIAMGRSIRLNDRYLMKVTGILAPVPANTDFQLKAVTSYSMTEFQNSTDWESIDDNLACYILLPQGMTAAAFEGPLRAFFKKVRPADVKDELTLGPLSRVHTFDAYAGNFSGKSIRPEVIRALWMIAAFILIIACVNFINLSTANSVNRAREVGVRKVLGGNKAQLRGQFLLETLLIVAGAVVVAVGLAVLALPAVAKIVDVPLSGRMLAQPVVGLFLLGLTVVVTFLAGSYPSLVLSGFNPSEALRSKLAFKITKGISLRRSLVVLQFVIAQALIIGTLVMIRQMDFFQNSSLGFDKNAIVSVRFPRDSVSLTRLDFLRDRLASLPGISRISFNSRGPADQDNPWTSLKFDHSAKETDWYTITKWADSNYITTYGIPLVAGANFRADDSVTEFLVTESFVKKLGILHPQDVIYKEINLWDMFKGPIVGVVKDFHATSLKDGIPPVMIAKYKPYFSNAGIKLTGRDVPGTLKAVEKLWNEVFPDYVFEYQFLDDRIAEFYKQEAQLSQLYKFFAAVAIFLSCLGLYGLASFMATQRIREIGVRKVLGATAGSIVLLFSREFVVLIGIAYLIAAPLAGWYMYSWLQDFTYRAPLSWWIFAAGGAISLLVALATVSMRAARAAGANPVKALKTE
ncbi:MAG TPA: FtsX-like permease family protein [Puia sp.]|jgi:predicted permease|nr:FtsX-like permease family protein [Puia sp.]